MIIGTIKKLNSQFDKRVSQTYNSYGCLRQLSCDCFQKSFGKKKIMNFNPQEKEQFEKFKVSENVNLSPVAYMVSILDEYFNKEITDDTFIQKLLSETKHAQFLFSRMPVAEIRSNQQLFKKEFEFADKICQLALEEKQGDELRIAVNDLIRNYNL